MFTKATKLNGDENIKSLVIVFTISNFEMTNKKNIIPKADKHKRKAINRNSRSRQSAVLNKPFNPNHPSHLRPFLLGDHFVLCRTTCIAVCHFPSSHQSSTAAQRNTKQCGTKKRAFQCALQTHNCRFHQRSMCVCWCDAEAFRANEY